VTTDVRSAAAKYYDLNPSLPQDIPFYKARIPSNQAQLLELGCGTGRVLVPLTHDCAYIHGLDASLAMIDICREKLRKANISPTRASVALENITSFNLNRTFDLIIAPFRVFQNLETDRQIEGLFSSIRKHLAPHGTCILNVFQPNRPPEVMRREWCTESETLTWEIAIEDRRVTSHDRRRRIDPDKLVLYPELVYRTYQRGDLVEEVVLQIPMRCHYPMEFEKLITNNGFTIKAHWGGYGGEPYGQGSELIVQFCVTG
jgi:SAM-dependent methyltransferase